MYKDKDKQKEVTAERVRRYRDKQKGVTSGGVTEKSVTRLDMIKQALGDLVKDIEKLGGQEARYERAYRYHLWKQGKGVPPILHAIVEDRDRLDKVYRSLSKQEKNVYYGLPYKGYSFDIIGEMLEVTR